MQRLQGLLLVACACGPGSADAGGSTSAGTSTSSTEGPSPTSSSTAADTTAAPMTSEGSSTGASSSSSSEGGYIMTPDIPIECLASYCDTWAEDCPDGEKCVPTTCASDRWERTSCVPLDPDPVAPGSPCLAPDGPYGGTDDCDLGSMCWNVDETTLAGTCVWHCSGSEANPLCPGNDACFIGYDGIIAVCLPRCDPLAPDCAADEACVFDDPAGADAFVCLPRSLEPAEAYGDDCSREPGCGTGLVCRPAQQVPGCAASDCCTTVGDLADPPVCPDASQSCLPLYPDGTAPPGLADLCFCGTG